MGKRDALTKALAVAGALLAWFPIVATVALTIIALVATGQFHVDYLMPAELFPAAFLGGGLLLGAAWRARARRGLVGWGLLAMVVLLFGTQALAVVTGLATGANEPAGWRWVLVLATLFAYTLALITTAVAGLLLLRDLSRPGGVPLARS
jgi:hypothetical protein